MPFLRSVPSLENLACRQLLAFFRTDWASGIENAWWGVNKWRENCTVLTWISANAYEFLRMFYGSRFLDLWLGICLPQNNAGNFQNDSAITFCPCFFLNIIDCYCSSWEQQREYVGTGGCSLCLGSGFRVWQKQQQTFDPLGKWSLCAENILSHPFASRRGSRHIP